MKKATRHGGRRPGAGRPSAFAWGEALLAAGVIATAGGLSAYDQARQRLADPSRMPSRVALWRWRRSRPLLEILLHEAEQLASDVRVGAPDARDRAATFQLACILLAQEWKRGESVGPVEDSPELRREIRQLVADFREGRR